MQIGSVVNREYRYQQMSKKQVTETGNYSNAVTEVATEGGGTFLGFTMIPEEGQFVVYGMRAKLLEESTPNNPIVQIISNLDGKKEVFNIDISQVDPKNATRMEMFALCSYADKMGQGIKSTFGTFKTLKIYDEIAELNGTGKVRDTTVTAWEQFQNERNNWWEIVEEVCNILKDNTDTKVLELFSKGKKLLGMFEKYSGSELSPKAMPTHPINVVECSVMSFPNADYSFYYNPSTGRLDCVNDNSSKVGRNVLWSKEISEAEYENCMVLFERYRGSTTWEYKYEAYLAHEEFWDMYLSGEVNQETLSKANEELTRGDLFNRLFENMPKNVRTAWGATLMEVGSVFSMNKDGNMKYFSELYRQLFLNFIGNNDMDVLGNTTETAMEYARSAMDNLSKKAGYSDSVKYLREKEHYFHKVFIDKLSK